MNDDAISLRIVIVPGGECDVLCVHGLVAGHTPNGDCIRVGVVGEAGCEPTVAFEILIRSAEWLVRSLQSALLGAEQAASTKKAVQS